MGKIYPLRIWRKSFERLETCARTIIKHLAFSRNWSELKSSFNMSFRDKDKRTYKHLCVELGKSPMETKQLLERHIVVKRCLQSLSLSMAQTGFRRFLGLTKLKNDWKTYCNHGKFDVECVEFTTKWRLPNCEGYCTMKQHCSSICTYDICRTCV